MDDEKRLRIRVSIPFDDIRYAGLIARFLSEISKGINARKFALFLMEEGLRSLALAEANATNEELRTIELESEPRNVAPARRRGMTQKRPLKQRTPVMPTSYEERNVGPTSKADTRALEPELVRSVETDVGDNSAVDRADIQSLRIAQIRDFINFD